MGYTRVIQVANLSPSVTREHMRNLFYPIGRISDMKLFPERDNPVIPVATKILFIKFDSSETVGVALHLNNTVFLDRMIDVRAYEPGKIPDETTALQAANALMMSHQATMSHLPMREDEVMKTIINPNQKKREDQIARTVVASNLPQHVNVDQVLNFFSQAGDVKFLRLANGNDEDGNDVRGAFIEYAALNSVSVALSLDSAFFEKETIIVRQSTIAIKDDNGEENKEYEESLKRVTEAQIIIAKAAGTGVESAVTPGTMGKKRPKSRSRSRTPRRSVSPGHHSRVRRSYSPAPRSRRRSRSRSRRRRSRSRSKRSKSKSRRHRSRSRTRRRRRSRSKSRDRKSKRRDKDDKKSPDKQEDTNEEKDEPESKHKDDSKDTEKQKKDSDSDEIEVEPVTKKKRHDSDEEEKKPKAYKRSRSRSKRRHRSKSRHRRSRSKRRHSRSRRKSRSRSRKRRSRRSRSIKHRDRRDRSKERRKRRSKSNEVKVKRDYDEEDKILVESTIKAMKSETDSESD